MKGDMELICSLAGLPGLRLFIKSLVFRPKQYHLITLRYLILNLTHLSIGLYLPPIFLN